LARALLRKKFFPSVSYFLPKFGIGIGNVCVKAAANAVPVAKQLTPRKKLVA